jgi:hypothetical protein
VVLDLLGLVEHNYLEVRLDEGVDLIADLLIVG